MQGSEQTDRSSGRTWRCKASGFALLASLTLSFVGAVGPLGRDAQAATPAASTSAAQQADAKIVFDIPAGDASKTLLQFYLQSQVQVLYLSQTVENVKTQAVQGELTPAQALKKMLEGTGLVFEFETQRSAVVRAAQRPKPGKLAAGRSILDSPDDAVVPVGMTDTLGTSDQQNLEEVVVTGSLIHGILDLMSPLVQVSRRDMRKTAYATTQDSLRILPFNSGSERGEDFGGTGNHNLGHAPNLRGLGHGATLVLVNGRRQPAAGFEGDFVDVSNIPSSAIERIEVLPDGSSALYGSDAIAGVVNIIMRDELQGFETQARFGTAIDGGAETHLAQLLGNRWDSGKVLLAYQYSKRSALAAADRTYAANSDKRPLGGSDHGSFRSNPGNILNPFTLTPAFAIPQDQDGTSLASDDLIPNVVNLQNRFEGVSLLPKREMHSVFLTGSQGIGEHFELFAEGRYSERNIRNKPLYTDQASLLFVPASNPFFVDPFGGLPFVIVAYNFLDDLGAYAGAGKTQSFVSTFGLKTLINDRWHAALSSSYGKESMIWIGQNVPDMAALSAALADPNPATAFNPFGDGTHTNPTTIDAIRGSNEYKTTSHITATSLVADGPLFNLPSGEVKLALGVEHRRESLDKGSLGNAMYDRNNSAAFAEFSVPLIGNPQNLRAIPRLELSMAGRYENYSDFGSAFNPKIGMRWAPLESVKLRTSWGTSFRAPRLLDLYDTTENAAGLLALKDPLSPTGNSIIVGRQGNNPGLNEETASTWTAGIDLMPTALSGLSLSLTYYAIDYEDRVLQPGPLSPFDILLYEDQWTEVITRNPTQAQIDEICNSPEFFGPREQCLENSPVAIIDYRKRNLASTSTEGLDIKISYALQTKLGYLDFDANGTYILNLEQALSRTSPAVDIVDTVLNPLALRMRGVVEWSQHGRNQQGLSASLAIDHTGRYRNDESFIRTEVNSLTMFDLHFSYQAPGNIGPWSDIDLALNATNIFNEEPPFIDSEWGYDFLNAEPTGRVISLYLQKKW